MKHRPRLPGVPRETSERIETVLSLLLRWNTQINLVSHGDTPLLRERHVEDALQLVELMPTHLTSAVDIGSGAGFPGLILAITTGVHFGLIEADKRKAAFLREAARATNAPVTVLNERAEAVVAEQVPLITARAFAPLPRLLETAHHLLAPDGVLLLPKGARIDNELTNARSTWNMRVEKFPSRTDPGATILRLSEVTRVQR